MWARGLARTRRRPSKTGNTIDPEALQDFKNWLSSRFSVKHVGTLYVYAIKYAHLLHEMNLSPLMELSSGCRRHALQALANYAKFLGCYGMFKNLMSDADLHWPSVTSPEIFKSIYDSNGNNGITDWVEKCGLLPHRYYFPIIFMTLTGLRPSEAINSLNIVSTRFGDYFNEELSLLEHFRFPVFMRNTKNCYISIVCPTLLAQLRQWHEYSSYPLLRHALRRKHLAVRLYDLRSWNATLLRTHGIESESIDLLQGRIPSSVFVRSYFRPSIKELATKVTDIMEPIAQQLLATQQTNRGL